MIQFATGYVAGFVSGMAVRNFESARKMTTVGLQVAINVLDMVRAAVEGEELSVKRMLDKVAKTANEARAATLKVKRAAA